MHSTFLFPDKRRKSRAALTAVLVCSLLCPGGAALGTPYRPNTAIEKFDEGSAAFAQGAYADALKAFQDSMTIEPSPNTRFKIAKCFKALSKTASAFVQFRRVIAEAQDRYNATGEARFLPTRDAAEAEAKLLEPDVPFLLLKVPADLPPDFAITLDGASLLRENWAAELPLDPGEHKVEARATRMNTFATTFVLTLREKRTVEVEVKRLPTALLTLRFGVRPAGMTASLDGQPIPPDQLEQLRVLDSGTHRVEVFAPGFVPYQWSKVLADRSALVLDVDLRPEVSGLRWTAVAVGVAAAASLGVAVGYAVNARDMANEQQMLPPLLRDPDVQGEVRTRATIANALFGVGGGLALTALTLGIASHFRGAGRAASTNKPPPPPPKVSFVPAGLGGSCLVRF